MITDHYLKVVVTQLTCGGLSEHYLKVLVIQ